MFWGISISTSFRLLPISTIIIESLLGGVSKARCSMCFSLMFCVNLTKIAFGLSLFLICVTARNGRGERLCGDMVKVSQNGQSCFFNTPFTFGTCPSKINNSLQERSSDVSKTRLSTY